MASLAGLLGSGLEAASNSLVPAATSALLPAATGAVASAATNMASKTPAVAKMTLDSLLAQKRQPIGELPDNLLNLRDSYNGYVGFKNENIGDYDTFGDELNHRDPLAIAQTGYDYQLKQTLGNAYEPTMTRLKNYARLGTSQQYDAAKKELSNWIQTPESDAVVEASRRLYPAGTQVWRAPNSSDGLSYSLTKEGAQKAFNGTTGKVVPYTIKESDRIIAPEFVERANSGAPQEEIIISPQVQQYLPQVQNAKGESLSEIHARLMAMREARNNLSSDVVRIGSSDVAQIDPTTRPANYDRLVDYMQTDPTARLENAIGAKLDSDDFPDKLVRFIEDEGYDVKKNIVDNVRTARRILDEQLLDEMSMEGGHTYRQFLETRSKLEQDNPGKGVGVRAHTISAENGQLYQTDAAKLDREYSDRLGIGRSHTPMADKTLSSDAQGNYIGGGIGVKEGYGNGESGVSTIAHERLHAWQDASLSDYHPDVVNAIDDLRSELKQYYHTPAQIKAYRKSGADMAYYSDPKEQEARMLQSYLDNKGYTKTYKVINNEKQEWGDEINPAFDKFFKKFREFSKKGIALPALGLIFGGATAAAGAGANRKS